LDDGVEEATDFAEASEIEDSVKKSCDEPLEYQTAAIVEEGLLWAVVVTEVSEAD
jgi:hypothetical protein